MPDMLFFMLEFTSTTSIRPCFFIFSFPFFSFPKFVRCVADMVCVCVPLMSFSVASTFL